MSACSLRRLHVPAVPPPDSHHVICQAWQHFWRPDGATALLWHPETVECCPNCHRRVHMEIVRMMREPNASTVADFDPLAAKLSVYGGRRLTREQAVAYRALTGWAAAGGSLPALRAAGLMGAQ